MATDLSESDARPDRDALRRKLDRFVGRPMVALAFVFLAVTAGVTHRLHGHISFLEEEVILLSLGLLWPLFVLEAGVHFALAETDQSFGRRLGYFVLLALLPPVRVGSRCYADHDQIWLPFLGPRRVDKELRKQLDRFFSAPMIVIALMVLPLLALEYVWAEAVQEHFSLKLLLDVGSSIIWTAFAVEFIVMVSVAEKKWTYCLRNWTDLAVVVLPLVEFMPFFRLLRLGRLFQLQQFGKMGRVYRLRGLSMKAWRAFLVLEVVQRLTGQRIETRLKRLRELLAAKEEEIADLRNEIAGLEKQLEVKSTTLPTDSGIARQAS
jgi:hypothetical protein